MKRLKESTIDFEKIWEYKDEDKFDLVSVYQSSGGKSTLAIFEDKRTGLYDIKEFDRNGRGGMNGGAYSFNDLVAVVANKYIDTPSYVCVYGDELQGEALLINRWYYSADDPRAKKMSDEQYEMSIRNVSLTKRGKNDLFENKKLKESSLSEKDIVKLASKYNIDLKVVDEYTDKLGITTETYKGKKIFMFVSSDRNDTIIYIEVDSVSLGGGFILKESFGEYPIRSKFSKGDKFKVKWPRWDNEIANCTISNVELDGLGYDEVTPLFNVYIRSLDSEGKTGLYDVEDDEDTFTEKELLKIIV